MRQRLRHGTAHHVEKLVQKYRRAKRLQDVEISNEQHRDRLDRYLAQQNIDKDTCVPEYYAGDRIDWDLAVANLFPSPAR